LKELGYCILRFYNNDIDESLEGVLTMISEMCKELKNRCYPPLNPLLEQEGGDKIH